MEALGASAKQYGKKLLPVLMQNLADKQSLVRADVVTTMDKWAEHTGAETVIGIGGALVIQDNPEMRSEMLKWVLKNKDAIKLVVEIKELVKPFLMCLNDKTPAIRALADEAITYVLPITGYGPFQQVISDLLPAVQNSIKPALEKIKQRVGATNIPQDAMNSSLGKSLPPEKAQAKKVEKPLIKPKTAQAKEE